MAINNIIVHITAKAHNKHKHSNRKWKMIDALQIVTDGCGTLETKESDYKFYFECGREQLACTKNTIQGLIRKYQ